MVPSQAPAIAAGQAVEAVENIGQPTSLLSQENKALVAGSELLDGSFVQSLTI